MLSYGQYCKLHPDIVLVDARSGGYPCFYCGLKSESIDHFLPQSYIDGIRKHIDISDTQDSVLKKIAAKQRLIPACKECNCLASDAVFNTPNEKKVYVKAKLRKRYTKLLSSPDWTKTEVNEMGYGLQVLIEGSEDLKVLIRKRLSW